MFTVHTEGTLIADGTEQTVAEATSVQRFSGYMSLGRMQAGDVVILRQYIKLFEAYEKYAEETHGNAQDSPIIHFTPKDIASGLRVTLQQTAGVLRSYQYKFMKETAPVHPVHYRV